VQSLCQGLSEAETRKIWQPFFDFMAQSPNAFKLKAQPAVISVPAQHWWDAEFMNARYPGVFLRDARPGTTDAANVWWANDGAQVGQFMYGYDSLWMPQSLLADAAQQRLADALFAASRQRGVALHFNKGLAGAPSEAIAAAKTIATNPSVQTAFALAICGGAQSPAYPGIAGHEPDQDRGREVAANIKAAMDELRKLAPDGGSYVSESNFSEPDWQRAHWGANYRRLAAVKRKYDPDGFFTVHHGVGSEDWSADGFTRR